MRQKLMDSEKGASLVETLLIMVLGAGAAVAVFKVLVPLVLSAVETLGQKLLEIVGAVGGAAW